MRGDDISGLELAQQFFRDAVAPVVARVAPGVRYTAGRFGARSDVLGFDDATSRDHGWGPECMLLLDATAFEDIAPVLDAALREQLPVRFRGYSTSYRDGCMVAIDTPPVEHGVELSTVERYLTYHIGAATAAELRAVDWLAIDEQKLLEVTSGALFHDDLRFGETRAQLAFYPDDLRLHLISVAPLNGKERLVAAAVVAAAPATGQRVDRYIEDRLLAPLGRIAGWYMSGTGGNHVVVLRDLDAIAVVTSVNYNTRGRHDQTTRLLEQHVWSRLRCPH